MKKLKTTDILLLSVAGILDIFQEFKDPGNLISNYYQNFYGFVPARWKKESYSSLVYQMIRDKKLVKVKTHNNYRFKITQRGINHIEKKFPQLKFQEKQWDGKWRILIFDIDEINRGTRDSLRIKLKYLGFGLLQKSVWISPYKVFPHLNKFIKENKLYKNVILLETSKLSLSNIEIIKIIWPIEAIEIKYNQIFRKMMLIKQKSGDKVNKKQLARNFNSIYKSLTYLVLQEPHLPHELLPTKWPYKKTINLAKRLRTKFLVEFDNDRG